MRILATDGLEAEAVKNLCDLGHEVIQQFYEPEELLTQIGLFDVLIVRSATKVRKPALDAAKAGNLKLILRGGVGLDNIDVEYAKEIGIKVSNTAGASSNAVAEHAIGLMFAAARYIGEATATMRAGAWNKKKYEGIELNGKTLGIVGLGRIGQRTAILGRALGMNVIAYSRTQKPEGKAVADYVTLNELFERSDFISLHVPGPIDGAPLVRAENIAKMKDGVVIVNAGRGSLVDEDALIAALDSGKVFAAGLDVFNDEPKVSAKLTSHPRVCCTPHIGSSTAEAQARIGEDLVAQIKAL